MKNLYIGCSGWTIAKEHSHLFPGEGSHLQQYAQLFNVVEINTTFYRLHKPATYTKWSLAVPEDFRFSIKVPRMLTHLGRLKDTEAIPPFLEGVRELKEKAGPLLVQLPPSLKYEEEVADQFFSSFRRHYEGSIVCEPRHESWFVPEAEHLLYEYQIARVAADPAIVPEAFLPGGWPKLRYYRLHGSPKMYYSAYDDEFLRVLYRQLRTDLENAEEVWCFFDNTASGAAVGNALSLKNMVQTASGR